MTDESSYRAYSLYDFIREKYLSTAKVVKDDGFSVALEISWVDDGHESWLFSLDQIEGIESIPYGRKNSDGFIIDGNDIIDKLLVDGVVSGEVILENLHVVKRSDGEAGLRWGTKLNMKHTE